MKTIITLLILSLATIAHGDSVITYDVKAIPVATDQVVGIDTPAGAWSVKRFSLQTILENLENDMGIEIHVNNLPAGLGADDLGAATAADVGALFSGTDDYLKADGTTGAGGSGDVAVDGTPTVDQVAVWVDASTIGGANAIVGTAGGLTGAYTDWDAVAGGTSILNKPDVFEMTTAGDIVYGGVAGAPTRLAGSAVDDYVLTYDLVTAAPYWAAGGAGAGFNEASNYSPTGIWDWSGVNVASTWPTFNQNTTGSAAEILNGGTGTALSVYVADNCSAVTGMATGDLCFEY